MLDRTILTMLFFGAYYNVSYAVGMFVRVVYLVCYSYVNIQKIIKKTDALNVVVLLFVSVVYNIILYNLCSLICCKNAD